MSTDRIKTTLTPCHNHRFVLRDRATAKNGGFNTLDVARAVEDKSMGSECASDQLAIVRPSEVHPAIVKLLCVKPPWS